MVGPQLIHPRDNGKHTANGKSISPTSPLLFDGCNPFDDTAETSSGLSCWDASASGSLPRDAVEAEVAHSWQQVEDLWQSKWFGVPQSCSSNFSVAQDRSCRNGCENTSYITEPASTSSAAGAGAAASFVRTSYKSGEANRAPAVSIPGSPLHVLGQSPFQLHSNPPAPLLPGTSASQMQNGTSAAPRAIQQTANINVPVLGTWANRQYKLPDRAAQEQGTALQEAGKQQNRAEQHQNGQQTRDADRDADDAVAEDAAWRWRFARRWHKEQARGFDPEDASLGDKMDEALEFLNAGGGAGWNMQLCPARTGSSELLGSMSNRSLGGTLGNSSILNGDLMLGDDGLNASTASRGPSALMEATREVSQLNYRAAKLLQQQQVCEQQAKELWREPSVSGGTWLGALVEPLEIDDWGSFKFVVLKMMGRNGKQRILICGHNYCSEADLVEQTTSKIVQLASKLGVPMEPIQMMGGGIMEWRRDRDRHLHMHSGFVVESTCRPTSPCELLSLAAVLTKQSLPVTYKVTAEGSSVL